MTTAQVVPPRLDDSTKFTKLEKVPVFKSHVRKVTDKQTKESRITKVDDAQLSVLCENTNKRIAKGEYPIITIGHRDFSKPETQQPPLVGYLGNHEMGEWAGEKAILADVFILNEYKAEAATYPRRSAEVFSKESPNGYIDSIALLRRPPELDLGMIAHFSKENIEIFELDNSEEDIDKGSESDSSESAEKLGQKIGNHVAETLASNQEFVISVGKASADAISDNPKFLDSLISRMGDLLEKRSNDVSSESGDNNVPENFELNPPAADNGTLEIRVAALQVGLDNSKAENTRLTAENDALRARCDRLEAFAKNAEDDKREAVRRRRLENIASQGVILNVDEHLEKYKKFDDSDFEFFAKSIEDNYARVPAGQMIDTGRTNTAPIPPRTKTEVPVDLTEAEMKAGAVEAFAKEHGIDIYSVNGSVTAVKEYLEKGDRSKFIGK